MNKTFSITLAIVSVIAVISTLFLRQVDVAILNEDFQIETLYGDPNLINEVFEISAIRQEGTNAFSRVVLTSEQAEITPINFDARHQLDDRQLEHREFYRGTHSWERGNYAWNNSRNNTENFSTLTTWRDTGSTIRILNHLTGEVVIISPETDRTSHFVFWADPFFLEYNGELFYILAEFNQPRISIYSVNFATEILEYQFSVGQVVQEGFMDGNGSWFATQNGLYFYVHDQLPSPRWIPLHWDPETVDTLEPSGNALYVLNFSTREFESRPSPTGIHTTWTRTRMGDHILIEGILAYDENDNLVVFDGSTLINLETGQRHILAETTPHTSGHNQWHDPTEFHGLGNYIIGIDRSQFTQHITIYDLDTMEKIYHGRINIRRDQGLLEGGWWGARSFDINLR